MVYDVNDDPLQTSGIGTCVVSSRLWCHVVWWHVTTSAMIVINMLALVSSFSKLLKALGHQTEVLQHNVSPAIFPRSRRALYIIVSANVIKLKLCLHLYQNISCRAIPDQIDRSSVPPVSTITEGKFYVSASSWVHLSAPAYTILP